MILETTCPVRTKGERLAGDVSLRGSTAGRPQTIWWPLACPDPRTRQRFLPVSFYADNLALSTPCFCLRRGAKSPPRGAGLAHSHTHLPAGPTETNNHSLISSRVQRLAPRQGPKDRGGLPSASRDSDRRVQTARPARTAQLSGTAMEPMDGGHRRSVERNGRPAASWPRIWAFSPRARPPRGQGQGMVPWLCAPSSRPGTPSVEGYASSGGAGGRDVSHTQPAPTLCLGDDARCSLEQGFCSRGPGLFPTGALQTPPQLLPQGG